MANLFKPVNLLSELGCICFGREVYMKGMGNGLAGLFIGKVVNGEMTSSVIHLSSLARDKEWVEDACLLGGIANMRGSGSCWLQVICWSDRSPSHW